jgi:two-component system, sensor histidine kinase and response regulator
MFEQASGYSPAQLAGMTPLDTVAPESRPAMERAVRLAFEQGSSEEEAALVTAAGRLRHCLITLNRLVIDGQPCIIGVSVDISKRTRAEDALRKSEQQYRLLFERNLAGVFRLAPDSTMLDCNPALLRIFGYRSVDEFRALGPRHVFFDPEEGAREFGRLLTEKTLEGLEVRLRRADGTPVWAVVNVCLIEDGQGRPALIEGSCWDISKRRDAELALRESEERFRELAENIEEVFFVLTMNPLRITYLSPAYEKVWGGPRAEAYRNPDAWAETVHPDDRRGVTRMLTQCTQGLASDDEYRIVRPDGSLRHIRARAFPILDAAGQFVNRVVGVAEDVTVDKQAEDELVMAKEEAEAASRVRGEFLANMSHELRTPIAGMMGMTDLALDTDLTAEQREYLGMAKSCADSLLTVINDILDFSKMEAGKLDFEAVEFDLRDRLEATVKVLALRAHEKGLHLNHRVRPDVPQTLIGDPGRLRQIIVNLVGNAVKFTEQGEVTVEVERQSETEDDVVLHVSVADTGIGIPADRQDAIFGAFTQADGSTSRRFGGTGLGLTISRRLAEMFGGRLWVESVAGQGSTFHFTAHFGVAADARCEVPFDHPVVLQGVPVLIVDDSATNRRILDEQTASWGMVPTLAADARAALASLHEADGAGRPFGVVLVDAMMPEMDGFTLVERMKHDPCFSTATIMMLSSANQRGDAARCRALGVAAYLVKPVGHSELLEALSRALGARPRDVETSSVPVATDPIPGRTPRLRVLLAEDNLVNRRIVMSVLEKRGHVVESVTNGREALDRLAAGAFDLVLMDVEMPVVDGFEATAAIREMEKTRGGHLRIVAMTAHALDSDRERCLAAGMDGYVSKPIHADELLAAIETT